MATVVHLVERVAEDGDNNLRDGIRAAIITVDDLVDTTPALIQARAVTLLTAQGHDLPAGYFTSNRLIATTFDAVGDLAIFTDKVGEAIA